MKMKSAPKGAPQNPAPQPESIAQLTRDVAELSARVDRLAADVEQLRDELRETTTAIRRDRVVCERRQCPPELLVDLAQLGDDPAIVAMIAWAMGEPTW